MSLTSFSRAMLFFRNFCPPPITFLPWIMTVLMIALSATLGDSKPVGCDRTDNRTAFVGENLSLPTGFAELHGKYFVYWYQKKDSETKSLVTFEPGDLEYFRSNLSLDNRTGALTLGPLSVNDSSVYVGEITNGDNGVCRFTYKVSVSEAGSSSGRSPNTAQTLSPCLAVILAAVLICQPFL